VPRYIELVTWAAHAGLITTEQREHLVAQADSNPRAAIVVSRHARQLREAIYQIFAAVAHGETPPPQALRLIHRNYIVALRNGQLRPLDDRIDWWWPERGPLHQVLWQIARSAADLLLSGQLSRVRQCPGDNGQCGWLFIDSTKNATRRWCSMRTCGGQIKSQRQAARRRAARSG
jgi:predicted RNA-binding Zn ribbon-like protein